MKNRLPLQRKFLIDWNGFKMWNCWFTQRGKINTFQLFVKCKSSIGKFPFLYNRTQYGSNYCA